MSDQGLLFDLAEDPDPLLIVSYGLGLDSTGMLVEMYNRGIRPDVILFADVGAEKQITYDYLPVISEWLESVGFPPITVVRRVPPIAPYKDIYENMVMNCTLPGATFGRGSCTTAWKIVPQDQWCAKDERCRALWAAGRKVTKAIGFGADEGYRTCRAADKAHTAEDPRYEYTYPLQDWGMGKADCERVIRAAGLPVPPKSACFFCPNQKPWEVRELLSPEERGKVMELERAAEPYNRKVHGLWRRPRKRDGRPGSIAEYIRAEGLPFVDAPRLPMNPNCKKAKTGYTFDPDEAAA